MYRKRSNTGESTEAESGFVVGGAGGRELEASPLGRQKVLQPGFADVLSVAELYKGASPEAQW